MIISDKVKELWFEQFAKTIDPCDMIWDFLIKDRMVLDSIISDLTERLEGKYKKWT